MALVWIVTTGNSDIRLISNEQWEFLAEKKKDLLKPCYRDFKELKRDNNNPSNPFPRSARVLGAVYDGDILDTHWQNLGFPLMKGFCETLKIQKQIPDRIILLLTNQEEIFFADHENLLYDRADHQSPYWKDTCTLKPILERYLRQEFKSAKIEFATLQPKTGNNGLDDWDATLKLVQDQFVNSNISKGDRVIVSHQAGTPAISSAVQLTSLIRFGKKVDFLVSSELNLVDGTSFLKGSSYFDTLQIKKLEDLLARDDYAGVANVVQSMELEDSENKIRLDYLLELAKLWNAAKFDEFATKMGDVATSRSKDWWWKGYEMAYLAIVRMKNGDPTEALFHSVRAIEGLICEWAIATHASNIHYSFIKLDRNGNPALNPRGSKVREYDSRRYRGDKEGSPIAKHTIDSRFENALKYQNQKDDLNRNKLGLYGRVLYTLFESTFEPNSRLTGHPISIVWEQLADERNELFHRLSGMTPQEVYEAWGKSNQEQWTKILLDCLNLVAGQSFASLKSASLMARVHEELVKEIKAIAKN